MSNKHSVAEVESHGLLHDQKKRRIVGDIAAQSVPGGTGGHLARSDRVGVRGIVQ